MPHAAFPRADELYWPHGPSARYFTYCAQAGVDPLGVDTGFLAGYAEGLRAQAADTEYRITAVSADQLLVVVRGYYRFAAESGAIETSPAETTAPRAHYATLAPITVDPGAVDAHQAAARWLLGYRGHTARAYECDLRDFYTWCFRAGVDPLGTERAHVEAWRTGLEARGMSASSVNRRLIAVRSFFHYAVDEQIVGRSPAAAVKPRRVPDVPRSTGLDRAELTVFLEVAAARNPGHYALMCLLGLNGLRASEPCSAEADGLATIRGHRVLYVIRKGFTDSVPVPLAPRTAGAIDAWLTVRPRRIPPGRDWDASSGPLFISEAGTRPTRQTVYGWVKTVSRVAHEEHRGRRRRRGLVADLAGLAHTERAGTGDAPSTPEPVGCWWDQCYTPASMLVAASNLGVEQVTVRSFCTQTWGVDHRPRRPQGR
ncbi:MAG: tyrosine-type recombinase/integrase [Actinomycetes bacterium]